MTKKTSTALDSIDRMLNPSSIAVVGATERLQYGGRFFRSVMHAKDRLRVYPVNPSHRELLGTKCYPRVSDLPESPDLVGIIVPYQHTMSILEDCAQAKARSAIIISAGFSERGNIERHALQREIRDFAHRSGVRVSGPNCLGIANIRSGIWASSSAPNPNLTYGPIAMISQSGASAFGPLMTRAIDMGIGYSHIISTGNEADLESSDFIEHLIQDPEIKVIACFIEGFKDGRKFLEVSRKALRLGKSIVLIKIGHSEVGSRAALSHTAALTGSDAVHNYAFKQYGVIRADDYDDLVQTAHLLAFSPTPSSDGIAVVSHSGGISSLVSDHLGQAGFNLPPLTVKAKTGLQQILGDFGWASNPADITGYANRGEFSQILNLLSQQRDAGVLVVATAGTNDQAKQITDLKKRVRKPIIFLSTGGDDVTLGIARLQEAHIPIYYSPQRLAKSLRGLFDHHNKRKWGLKSGTKETNIKLYAPLPIGNHTLTEHKAKELLSHWGIPGTNEVQVNSLDEAIQASEIVGFPLAIKLESPLITHKTEAGVVKLNIENTKQLQQAYKEIVALGLKYSPQTSGAPVLVQELITEGTEVIVGLSQDPTFGPVLLFGLGGIFVEAINDVSIRVCPIDKRDALEMVQETKGSRLLQGFRGRPKGDIDALIKSLLAVSDLARDLHDRKPELDINPLIVLPEGRGVKSLDALVTLG